MKIVILSSLKILLHGTTQLRCIQPSEYLQSLGHDVSIRDIDRFIPYFEDIIIIHRGIGTRYTKAFVNYAKSKGIIIVYDTDDLIFDQESVDYLSFLGFPKYKKKMKSIIELMKICDVISAI